MRRASLHWANCAVQKLLLQCNISEILPRKCVVDQIDPLCKYNSSWQWTLLEWNNMQGCVICRVYNIGQFSFHGTSAHNCQILWCGTEIVIVSSVEELMTDFWLLAFRGSPSNFSMFSMSKLNSSWQWTLHGNDINSVWYRPIFVSWGDFCSQLSNVMWCTDHYCTVFVDIDQNVLAKVSSLYK